MKHQGAHRRVKNPRHLRSNRAMIDTPLVADPISGGIFSVSDTANGAEMLDHFIIERIRREHNPSKSGRIPLRIEDVYPNHSQHPDRPERREREKKPERGVAIIDFTI